MRLFPGGYLAGPFRVRSGRRSEWTPRRALAILVVTVLTVTLPATGVAAPPRPSEDRIATERADARAMAARVGELTNRLAATKDELRSLSARVESKLEIANKARVDLRRAERAYARAKREADFAAARADAAARKVNRRRHRMDEFVAHSYQQGFRLGSMPAFVGAENPGEVLDRAMLLDVISSTQLDVLDRLRRARTERANRESRARQALQQAAAKRTAAERARAAAATAKDAAVAARRTEQERARRIRAEIARVEAELARARAKVAELESRRERHPDRPVQEQRAERENAATSTPSGGGGIPGAGSPSTTGTSSSAVETVVRRALSQLGVTYAWGGGNAHGPTKGIRDGGVADAHGDYKKIGFDCSGLMVYAFAGVGIDLPHYSGYQYRTGRHVPLSRIQRGDMLFWNDGGSIHHVALYLGNGRMVEAPYSGGHVRVVPVRYDGIAPYAVRLL